MKNKNLLNLVGRESYEQTRMSRNSLDSIVSRFSLVSLICVLMLTLGVGNAWGAAVASQAPANGKSFIIALYYNSTYYALPANLTNTGVTPAGLACTLDANNKVSAISTCDTPDECLWYFETATGGYNISYVDADDVTRYLYKNGTTGNNYNISANPSYKTKSVWAFTSGTANSVTAYSMKTTKSEATKHTVIKAKNNTSFQVNGTSNSYSVTLLEVAPRITCATTSLSGFTYVQGSGPSAAQSFSVSGSHLTANITVTAPTNYEVSTSSGSGYGNSVTLTKNASGVVAATTVYVRLKSGLSANTYNGSISIASTGATTKSITLSGSVTAPASTWKFKYSGDSWTEHTMTESAGTASYSISLAADSRFEFGIDDNGTFYKNSGTIITTTSGWVFNTSDNNCKIHTGPAGTYTFAINTTSKAVTVTYPTVDHPNDHYVYFKNTNVWGTVYGYLGNSGNDNKAAAWPGSVMQPTTTICGETYHYAALNAMSGTYNVINFNNGGSGYGNQTSDLSTTGSLGKYNANQDANWHQFKYSISFEGNGNTGGSMSEVSNICPGTNQTLASNGFTKTDHTFTGWKANVDVKIGGSTVTAGTLITNAATIQDIQSDITLTAQWEHVPVITVSQTSRAFGDRKVSGGPYEMTFTVSGSYLKGNISLAVSGTNAAMFSVSPTSLSPTTGTVSSTEITVSYSPTGAGSHSAQIDITSSSATSKTVTLSGTGKWEVIWSVNGVETPTLVANSTKPTLPSPDPSSCDLTSTTFKGWATSSWAGKLDDVSDKTIHASNSTMSNITANGTTFYAVWAKQAGSAPAAATMTGSYSSHTGWTESNLCGSTYWILCSDGTLTSPSFSDLSKVTSIDFSARTYGGSSYKTINVETSGGTSVGSTDATSGTMSSGYSISVSGLSGSGSLVFSSSTTSAANGPGINNITINYTTGGYTYSKYLTTCGACTADPDMTDAASALKGAFSLSSVGVTATDWNTGSAFCSWVDYGFVWGTSANPTVSNNKVQVGTSGSATTWDGALTGDFSVDLTYHYRAYGKNAKDAAAFQYSADQTFIPRSVTFNLNGHGSSTPSTQYVPNGGKAADPSYSEVVAGWTFGGWYDNADWTQGTQWNFGTSTVSGASVTLYAKWTEKPKYTITLNAGNGTVSADGWTAGDSPTWSKTQANGDEEITFPAANPGCAGWVFKGWKQGSAADDQGSFTPDKTTGATLTPTSNVTYYAVYRQSTPSGTTYSKITSVGDLATTDYAIIAAFSESGNYYAMKNAKNGTYMQETSFTHADSWTNSDADYIWKVLVFGDKVAFYNADEEKFLTIVNGAWELATDGQFFTYSFNSTTKAWTFSSPSGKQLTYSTQFYVGDSQNKAIYLYKRGEAESGNYFTNPSCSDIAVNGVANPAAGGTVQLTATAAKSGDKVWACYTADEDYNFTNWSISGTGASLSSTSAQFTEITVGSADVTATANFTAKVWRTVTWKANGVTLTGGDLGSASVKVEDGHNITTLPPTPTSCESGDGASDQFIGWVVNSENWGNKINDVSAKHIYKRASQFPTVTGDVTYHAVWAASDNTQNHWEKVTDIDDVEAGFKYAIISFDDAYYVKNTDQSTDKPSVYAVTKTSGNINYTSDMEFTASAGAYGGFIFTSVAVSGVKIWGSSTNDGVIVSTTSAKANASDEWFPELNATYGVIMTTSNSKYLCTYGTNDWRNYSSGFNASNRAANLYKYAYGHKNYMTLCCDKAITIASPTKTGSGTVTFTEDSPVPTCLGATTDIHVKITPSNGHKCTALTFTREDGEDIVIDVDPAAVIPFTAATDFVITVEQNANTTLNTSVTFTALHDYYIDNMHYNSTIDKSGGYGTAPTLSDESKGEQCTGLHYKFVGWIPETDMNMTTGVPTTTANMVAGGATGKYATGTNYYAIWAEEE